MNNSANLKKISGFLFIATIIALIVHLVGLDLFNKRIIDVHGNDSSSASYMEIDTRKDSTSTWIKRDYDLFGNTVNLTGATIDGELHNKSNDTIDNWTLTINIKGDCLINQAWNGEVEIHQFVGTTDEVVQRINLQNYNLDDVKFKHLYDGDLLIPLRAGDYVIYFPNERFKETPLAGNDSTKIGVIFYYLDTLDLSDYDLALQYHRTFTQGPLFLVFALLAILCFIFILMFAVSDITYRRAQNEMELRKSGISSLSDMYAAIYLIDLTTGDMTPVATDKNSELHHSKRSGAKAYLEMVIEDAEEAYRDIVREFCDIDTLAERLKSRGSIVCEYISKKYGWNSMRFFAMDRVEGQPLEKVVFTVQDVNEEKSELDRIEERVTRAESETEAKAIFMANVSQEIREPLNEMLDLGKRISSNSSEERTRLDACELYDLGSDLLAYVDDILDYSKLESGNLQLVPANYSLENLIRENAQRAGLQLEKRGLAFDMEASETLPSGLHGDAARLNQVIDIVISHAAEAIDSGGVKLSLFGKASEDKVHLLVSVRTTGQIEDVDHTQTRQSFSTSGNVSMQLAKGLLSLMDSELKTVHSDDAWREYYFEIEQDITDSTPLGRMEAQW